MRDLLIYIEIYRGAKHTVRVSETMILKTLIMELAEVWRIPEAELILCRETARPLDSQISLQENQIVTGDHILWI
ncbi:hypothetical protein [Catenisphaera adipataccumulans]|uniref:Ubiquitin-like domain-containing protein n=1 Tax=Catenisphaera adipataccumulans TaxID=700500 RepID=A0A7W8FWR7_9FIRM|nr:hypothetical protein [Catenisphaera adipataccumulans]MBB5183581.1 hypothetical protein [Catenisphaera adipataccumulans]